MKPAFTYARLRKGDAYRKQTQRECDKVVRYINKFNYFIKFQEARIEIRSSDDSEDIDDKDDQKIKNNNNNKRKRQAPSGKETVSSIAPTVESPAKRTNVRSLDDIQAENSAKIIKDKAVDEAESGGNSIGTRSTPREDHGASASPKRLSQAEVDVQESEAEDESTKRGDAATVGVVTDMSHDSWEDFVVHFQDQMQRYRNLVRDLSEGDCTEDNVHNFEGEVRCLGSQLVSVWNACSTKDIVKSRDKQLLSYVAAYCETHNRPQMNGEFLVFLAHCVEGMNCLQY